MLNFKKFLFAFLDHFESWLCQLLLIFFVCMIFLQIIMRYLAVSVPWTEELARFAFLWFVLFGACYASRQGAMNRVLVQFSRLDSRTRAIFLYIGDIIWLIFCLTLAWQGFLAVGHLREYPCYTPALDWNLAYVYLIFPVSFLLMAIRIIQVCCLRFMGKENDGNPEQAIAQAIESEVSSEQASVKK